MSEPAWWQEIEGPAGASLPPAHWVALYRDLEKTLSAIALERPEMAPRLWDVRRRLRHWEVEGRRLTEPALAAGLAGRG